jgi:hypothetical protein
MHFDDFVFQHYSHLLFDNFVIKLRLYNLFHKYNSYVIETVNDI